MPITFVVFNIEEKWILKCSLEMKVEKLWAVWMCVYKHFLMVKYYPSDIQCNTICVLACVMFRGSSIWNAFIIYSPPHFTTILFSALSTAACCVLSEGFFLKCICTQPVCLFLFAVLFLYSLSTTLRNLKNMDVICRFNLIWDFTFYTLH